MQITLSTHAGSIRGWFAAMNPDEVDVVISILMLLRPRLQPEASRDPPADPVTAEE